MSVPVLTYAHRGGSASPLQHEFLELNNNDSENNNTMITM